MTRITLKIVTKSEADTSSKHVSCRFGINFLNRKKNLDSLCVETMIEIHFFKVLIRAIHVWLILVLTERVVQVLDINHIEIGSLACRFSTITACHETFNRNVLMFIDFKIASVTLLSITKVYVNDINALAVLYTKWNSAKTTGTYATFNDKVLGCSIELVLTVITLIIKDCFFFLII